MIYKAMAEQDQARFVYWQQRAERAEAALKYTSELVEEHQTTPGKTWISTYENIIARIGERANKVLAQGED